MKHGAAPFEEVDMLQQLGFGAVQKPAFSIAKAGHKYLNWMRGNARRQARRA